MSGVNVRYSFFFFFILYMRTSLFGIAVRTAEVSKKRRGRAWLDVVLTKLRPDSPEVDGIKQDHSVGSAGTGHDICCF